MNIFERVFRQPVRARITPEENLATEIVAYLLETFTPFRRRFLDGIGIASDHEDTWDVLTQQVLGGSGSWQGKIPDLVLNCRRTKTEVLIEVKIDAATTFDGSIAQTQHYKTYLNHAESQARITRGVLVTLTRWSPDPTLREPADTVIRFGDVADWLDEAVGQANPDMQGEAHIARQWAEYLRDRRWAMAKLTKRHVDSIRPMAELVGQLWDVVGSATEELASNDAWQRTGRSSSGAIGDGLQAIWGAPLQQVGNEQLIVQLGMAYGQEHSETLLCPTLYLIGSPEVARKLKGNAENFWKGQLIKLSNFANQVGEDSTDRDYWSEARRELIEAANATIGSS